MGLILRRSLPDAEKNFLYPMIREIPGGMYRYDGQKHIIKWTNGSMTELGFCRNKIDVLRYQGLEYDYIGIEEITQWEEEEYDILMGSLRSTKPGIIPNFFCTGNPGGRGHAWVKNRWVLKHGNNPDYDPKDYAFIPSKIGDNKILQERDPSYVRWLNSLPEKLRAALRDGDWDVFDGQYFDEWRRDIHVIAPFHPGPKTVRKRLISFDYGYTAPSAVFWMAQLYDGTIVVYRELYITGHTYRQLATRIVAMTPAWEMEEIGGNVF